MTSDSHRIKLAHRTEGYRTKSGIRAEGCRIKLGSALKGTEVDSRPALALKATHTTHTKLTLHAKGYGIKPGPRLTCSTAAKSTAGEAASTGLENATPAKAATAAAAAAAAAADTLGFA